MRVRNQNSSTAPTKSVSLSDLYTLTGPRNASKRRKALQKDEQYISSVTLICMARVVKQLNDIAHRLLFITPQSISLAKTFTGLNVSSPTVVKRGVILSEV